MYNCTLTMLVSPPLLHTMKKLREIEPNVNVVITKKVVKCVLHAVSVKCRKGLCWYNALYIRRIHLMKIIISKIILRLMKINAIGE